MMKMIAQKLGKNDKADKLSFVRSNGTESICSMPRQGTLPHDLIHYVIESALPLQHGFLSQVAAGADALFVMEMTHDKTNSQLETEAVQAEAIVEALQTQLWAGYFDEASFLEAARLASEARGKPVFDFSNVVSEQLYLSAQELLATWNALPIHQELTLIFEGKRE